ncbi:MAG: glycosyltransferase family 9 protein [Sedimentisphaerales bacterium]|nr:glycosyltransferase family 9 protein [Sedimentisphaerales bacterium]
MTQQPNNILIIKPSSLGDIVLALPALSALRSSFPQARISWLVRPEFADLLRGHPDLNELIMFDRRLLGKGWYSPRAFSEFRRLIRQLRDARFDLVFDFQGLFRTGFLAWMTGCKRRFGQAGAREFATLFYTQVVEQDYSCVHLVDYYLRMVKEAGAQTGKPDFKLPEDASAVEAANKLLLGHNVNPEKYAVLVSCAARPEKLWPIERFAQLTDKITEKFGFSIVAIGSRGERPYIDKLAFSAKSRIVNLAGQTSLRELTALLKRASLVISNDTGPGHIAAALGVPMVMIFGPVNPARLYPYKRPDCFVAVEPNEMRMDIESRDPRYNINNITVEQVWEKVCGRLRKV